MATASADAVKLGDPSDASPRLYTLEHELEQEKAALPQAVLSLVPDAAEAYRIHVDPAIVAANPPAFVIDLPGVAPLEAVRAKFVDDRPDWKSWLGELRYADNGLPAGSIQIGFHGDRITALVELDTGERYRIVGGPEDRQRLVRLNPELTPPPCGLDTSGTVAPPSGRKPPRAGRRSSAVEKITSCAANARLDVLVVYPSRNPTTGRDGFFELSAAEESALFTFVECSITRANQVFSNNGINATYKLLGPVPLVEAQPPASGIADALSWLNGNPSEVVSLRNAFGADIVAIYLPFNWDSLKACGYANLPDNVDPNQPPFTAHRSGCGLDDLTLAHEIGHNFGMRHDDDADDQSDLFTWGKGYVFLDPGSGQQRATVMGCPPCPVPGTCGAGPNPVCNRIPYFSDPDKKPFSEVPIGTADHHNARVACDQVAGYAALKAPSTNTPPNASFTVTCSGLTCTFNASGTTDNASIPSTNYWWDFGDGTSVTRGTRNTTYTYSSAGSRRVHLVVKDGGGQTGVVWSTANPWNPIHEGRHETSNCGTIHGWAWDQVIPNTPISVDIYRDGTKVATVPANLFGQDLYNAGKGNGYHRFHYAPTSSAWRDGRWHTATVRFAGTSTNLTWTGQSFICNARIFTTQLPAENLSTGGQVHTVATELSSTHSGYIDKLGFYRASGETGTNTLRLWTDSGTKLAEQTAACTSAGWCWVSIPGVFINANTRYRVSVNTNTFQARTGCGLGSGITNSPLTAHSGFWSAGDTFPTAGSCSNFFVDVSFVM